MGQLIAKAAVQTVTVVVTLTAALAVVGYLENRALRKKSGEAQ